MTICLNNSKSCESDFNNPSGILIFKSERTNFKESIRVWKIKDPENYKFKADLLNFAQKTKSRFAELIQNEIQTPKSVKTRAVRRSTTNGEKQEMEQCFKQRDPAVFNRNNSATVNSVFGRSIDEFKGEIEAWSQGGSGWVVQVVFFF